MQQFDVIFLYRVYINVCILNYIFIYQVIEIILEIRMFIVIVGVNNDLVDVRKKEFKVNFF